MLVDSTILQMAFMAMKRPLDERARKKAFDEIFQKFDHNRNGKTTTIDERYYKGITF